MRLELKYRGAKVLFDDQQQSLVSVIATLKFCSLLLNMAGLKAHYSATAILLNTQFNTTKVASYIL